MGRQYAYFTAEDDQTAAAAFALGAWPPPTFPTKDIGLTEDIRVDELPDLESLLTGRSVEEITADPRCYAEIVSELDEHAGVEECGIMAVTDTFTRALAAADLSTLPEQYYGSTLPETYYHYYGDALRQLAAVARVGPRWTDQRGPEQVGRRHQRDGDHCFFLTRPWRRAAGWFQCGYSAAVGAPASG
jgi:hypothetical protein